jgi:ribosomal protein S6
MFYSLDFVITEFADAKAIQKINKEVEKIIASSGSKILEKREIGRKKLAYEIGKNQFGTFFNLILTAPVENINHIQKDIKKMEELIRALIIKIKYLPEKTKKEEPEKILKTKEIIKEKSIKKVEKDIKDKPVEKVKKAEEIENPEVKKVIKKPKKIISKKPDKSKEIISKIEKDKDTMKKLDEQLEEILKE